MTALSEPRRLAAEALGTAGLLAAVVGSGAVVADGPSASALFEHAVVVGAALTALIMVLGPVSGAHFNPAVTVATALLGGTPWPRAARYLGAQLVGATAGVAFTHLTMGLGGLRIATTERAPGAAMAVSEGAVTAGLLVLILGLVRTGRERLVPGAVGLYVAAAIHYSASDAFANPAVTVGRLLTDTWTGIAPASAGWFLAGQAAGAVAAVALVRWLFAPAPIDASRAPVPVTDPADR